MASAICPVGTAKYDRRYIITLRIYFLKGTCARDLYLGMWLLQMTCENPSGEELPGRHIITEFVALQHFIAHGNVAKLMVYYSLSWFTDWLLIDSGYFLGLPL